MTVTLEIVGTIKVQDTAGSGAILGPDPTASLSVVEHVRGLGTLATAGTLTVPFGNCAAAKFLAIKVSGLATATVTINGVANVCAMSGCNVWQQSGGLITSATVTQTTGSDITVESLVAGST